MPRFIDADALIDELSGYYKKAATDGNLTVACACGMLIGIVRRTETAVAIEELLAENKEILYRVEIAENMIASYQ